MAEQPGEEAGQARDVCAEECWCLRYFETQLDRERIDQIGQYLPLTGHCQDGRFTRNRLHNAGTSTRHVFL